LWAAVPISAAVIAEIPCKCDVVRFQKTGKKET
jgi:hypothetical protein